MRATAEYTRVHTRQDETGLTVRSFSTQLEWENYNLGYDAARLRKGRPTMANTDAYRLGWYDYYDQANI